MGTIPGTPSLDLSKTVTVKSAARTRLQRKDHSNALKTKFNNFGGFKSHAFAASLQFCTMRANLVYPLLNKSLASPEFASAMAANHVMPRASIELRNNNTAAAMLLLGRVPRHVTPSFSKAIEALPSFMLGSAGRTWRHLSANAGKLSQRMPSCVRTVSEVWMDHTHNWREFKPHLACTDVVKPICHKEATSATSEDNNALCMPRYHPMTYTCPATMRILASKVCACASSSCARCTGTVIGKINRLTTSPCDDAKDGLCSASMTMYVLAIFATCAHCGGSPAMTWASRVFKNGLNHVMLAAASNMPFFSSDLHACASFQGAL